MKNLFKLDSEKNDKKEYKMVFWELSNYNITELSIYLCS